MKNKKIVLKNALVSIFILAFFLAGEANAQWRASSFGYGLPSGSIYRIIEKFLLWLLGIFGFFGVIGFVISGIMYLTAAGDEGQIGKAKKAMTVSILGVIVGLSGYVIIKAVDWALMGTTSVY